MIDRTLFEVSSSDLNGVHILTAHGRLTIGDATEHLNQVLKSAVTDGSAKVIINLNDVPQVDSSGLSSLVRVSIELARRGGALHLVCGPGRVREALSVTRLIEVIPTFNDDSSAAAAFS
jgi:anti-anti-sigma factor